MCCDDTLLLVFIRITIRENINPSESLTFFLRTPRFPKIVRPNVFYAIGPQRPRKIDELVHVL